MEFRTASIETLELLYMKIEVAYFISSPRHQVSAMGNNNKM